jgi:peptidoglycan hydrolase-like protein with peptidoglycan-binding domain
MAYLRYGDRGPQVKRLQRALNDNPYYKPKPKLKVDGEMKNLTCAAVQDSKFLIGYPKDHLDPDARDQIAGELLLKLLERRLPLPPEYARRRKARLAQKRKRNSIVSQQTLMRRRALKCVKAEVGTMERGNNRIRYNDWWGWGPVAYCVIGISWCWVKAGSVAFKKGSRWAGTDAMLWDAKAGRNGIHLTSSPKAGCPGVIDFNGHSDPDHAITFIKWANREKTLVTTAEFNTGGPNGVQGVWYKTRPNWQCWWMEVER